MKKIVVGILIGFLFVFTACNDDEDGYSLNDMWIGFGIFQSDDSNNYQIVMDNKDQLIPIASNYRAGWEKSFENGDRILVNYTVLDEKLDNSNKVEKYFVKVNQIKNILMKGIMDITPENKDSIGNDPIVVENYWITDSLLNFKLKYWGNNAIHFLNLVKKPSMIMAPEAQPFELELRHNANEDEKSFYYSAYVSFSLNDLRIEGQDSVRFIVTATDYDGDEFSEEEVFDYSDLGE